MRRSLTAIRITALAVLVAMPAACNPGSEAITRPDTESSEPLHARHAGATRMNELIAAARAATAKYHDVNAARAAGYVEDGFGCISDPAMGAMGIHFINLEIDADPAIDLAKPELLLYEPGKNGKLTLVGVEYEVFQADWWDAGNTTPPSLFGHEFEPLVFPGLAPLFALHVWLWRHNPTGMIQDFNHAVSCP